MASCVWCGNLPTHFEIPLNHNYSNFRNYQNRLIYPHYNYTEAFRSNGKDIGNLFCVYCGIGFLTPAESTDHAQAHRKHFCFVCGIEAHLPAQEPCEQHCRMIRHISKSTTTKARPPQTGGPPIQFKKILDHGSKPHISPYSTQRQNLKEEKYVRTADLLKWQEGLTVEQRTSVDVKAAGPGQQADFLSDLDLRQVALMMRSRGA